MAGPAATAHGCLGITGAVFRAVLVEEKETERKCMCVCGVRVPMCVPISVYAWRELVIVVGDALVMHVCWCCS